VQAAITQFKKAQAEWRDVRAEAITNGTPVPLPPKALTVCYKPITMLVTAMLYRREFGAKAVVTYHGKLSIKEKVARQNRFEETPVFNDHKLSKNQPNEDVIHCVGTTNTMSLGVTFLRATQIFILEPMYDPSQEKQVSKRSHRCGQTAEVFVWTYSNVREIPWEAKIANTADARALFTAHVDQDDDEKVVRISRLNIKDDTNSPAKPLLIE